MGGGRQGPRCSSVPVKIGHGTLMAAVHARFPACLAPERLTSSLQNWNHAQPSVSRQSCEQFSGLSSKEGGASGGPVITAARGATTAMPPPASALS